MPDLLSFVPLTAETLDTIRQRFDSDASAGQDPASESITDTTEGGFFWDITQAAGLVLARLWDLASTEVPAVAFPAFAWGEYLDDHGETLGLSRKDATQATGVLTFTGTNGKLIAQGTEVGTPPVSGQDPIVFSTDSDVTIASGTASVTATADDPGAAGEVGANNLTQLLSPNPDISGVTNAVPMAGGSDVESDENYRDRILTVLSSPQGAGTVSDYERWALAYPGVGSVTVTPIWAGAGTVQVVVTDPNKQPTTETVTYGLQDQLDPPGVQSTLTTGATLPTGTLHANTTGFTASGTIRVADQTVAYTGTTSSTFTGCTGGTGTFAIGERVAQNFGKGGGLAPIGAVVTVQTVTGVPITLTATVVHKPGYSLTGASGTIATHDDIVDSFNAYLATLGPGDDVILASAIGRIVKVTGVEDTTGVQLNGSATNVTIAASAVAQPGTPVLS